jgi:ribonucleotide reductase alpha subunit
MYYIMRVTKRSGRVEDVKFDNVTNRISKLTEGLSNSVDVTKVAQQVFSSIYDGINTHEIDTLSAEICIGMITSDPDYEILATRITASNIQKRAANNFHIAMRKLHKAGIVTHEVLEVSSKVKDDIKPERDYDFGYFGLKTLEKGYLQKIDGEIIETPQYMYMRVAIGIHGHDTERVLETYDALSKGLFIHATPTLFNAGTPRPQMSSCFVAGTAVFTTNRGPVPIEEVCIGDNVVTHTGSIKPVLQTHKNLLGDRTLFDVKIYKTPGFQVTGNHRFWSITKEQLHWKDEPQWNSIEHLRVGDWISIPKTNLNTVYEILDMYELLKDENGTEHWTYSFEFDGTKMRRLTHFTSEYRPNGITLKGEWFERYIKVDEDFAWFIGSWYGDGCITYQRSSAKSKRTPTHRGISFAQNPNNTTFIEKIEKIGCKYLGVHACISKSKKRNCLSISFNNSAIGNAFNILFGRWSSGKFLWPNMYSWNRNMVSAFIGGLVSTDGCCTLRGNVTVQLTNQPLIKSIFHLSRSVGLDTSLTVGSKPYKDRKQYIGRIQFPWIPEIMKWVYKHYDDNRLYKSERANTTLEIDGKIFLRINAKTRVKDNLPEFVYTLGVKDDHSYTVQGVIAENCFLIANKEDSIDGIYDTVKECARISKWAGGIGLHIHDVRANKSHIRGTNGTSDGIIPMLRVYNSTARYVNQAGRRKGSIAVYLEPWHADILDFLEIRLNQGDEEARCRDLFSAMWIPDLFMKRVESGGNWSLFCPDQAKGLSDVYGKEFEDLYEKYETEGLARKVVPASEVWKAIIKSQSETGTPYMLYKDACNEKSNHKHVGTIKSSNLCVAPETKILTSKGQQIISELVDQDVEVWNGDEFSNVTIRQTGKNQKLLTVKTSKGLELRCTPYHKFWIVGHSEPIEAQNLEKGMETIRYSLPDDNDTHFDKIVSVEDLGETSDTFCFNEPLKHRGIFNGILTGNCTEIIEYTDKDETAVCNLASIALPKYVDVEKKEFNHEELHRVTKMVTRNLNKVIDKNFYPTENGERSNMRHRPIGIGVQGLADVFIMLRMSFGSEESRKLNRDIFETIYHASLESSCELAEMYGTYETFKGSPFSQGILQFDMWDRDPKFSGRYDWNAMRELVKKGTRNSLLLAPMPTASTSQILGNNECFEPYTTNIYLRRTLAGEFVVVNKHLVNDLKERGLWSKEMKDLMVKANGSVQNIIDIPDDLKELYKTVWEMSQKTIIDMAADRGVYIDQSQSMNLFVESPTLSKLSSMHMYAWKTGLKTGMYYLRSKAKARPIQFSLEAECAMCSA